MLGERLRKIRTDRGLSINRLAEASGLTPSFISQVERSQTSPSIASLREICRVLEIPVFTLFLEDGEDRIVVRREERKQIKYPESSVTFELLTPDLSRKMEIVMATLKPGQSSSNTPTSHLGEEGVVVLSGETRAHIAGERYDLGEGDCIYYDSGLPHTFENIADRDVVLLFVVTPPSF